MSNTTIQFYYASIAAASSGRLRPPPAVSVRLWLAVEWSGLYSVLVDICAAWCCHSKLWLKVTILERLLTSLDVVVVREVWYLWLVEIICIDWMYTYSRWILDTDNILSICWNILIVKGILCYFKWICFNPYYEIILTWFIPLVPPWSLWYRCPLVTNMACVRHWRAQCSMLTSVKD